MFSGKTMTLLLGAAAAVALLVVVLMDFGTGTSPVESAAPQQTTKESEAAGTGGVSGESADAPRAGSAGVTMAGQGGRALLSGIAGIKDPKAREAYLAGVVGRLAALGPEKALEQVRALPDAETRDMAMLALLMEWSGLTTLDVVRGGDVWRFGTEGALAVYLLENGKISPELAASMASASTGANRPADLLSAVAAKLVATDPAAALALGQRLDGRQQMRFYESLAGGWASSNPAAAREWASRIEDPALRARVLASVLQAEASANPASAARQFAQFPPENAELRARLAARIAESWAGKDTLAALQWSAGLTDPASRAAANDGIQRVAPVGIGARLTSGEDGLPVLVDFVPGSPASASGQLRPGDKVVAVGDGVGGWVSANGRPLGDVVGLIRGSPNTQVTLQVQSPGSSAPRVVTIGRQQIVHRPQ